MTSGVVRIFAYGSSISVRGEKMQDDVDMSRLSRTDGCLRMGAEKGTGGDRWIVDQRMDMESLPQRSCVVWQRSGLNNRYALV